MIRPCPNCGNYDFAAEDDSQICRETELRSGFVRDRVDHSLPLGGLMDLTRFMHGGAGRLTFCRRCGLAMREDSMAADYTDDSYDLDLVNHLYPRYLRAFQEKERPYRTLLPPNAHVAELGSHLGAFLETAENWNWRATGLDVGRETRAFAAARGLRLQGSLAETRLPRHSQDGLFIWNCFEQLDEPSRTLAAARDLVKPFGLLVVRTPNFDFYRRLASALKRDGQAIRRLAYNNLLGFPYLIGYTPLSLVSLLMAHGFEPIAGIDSNLIITPYPDLTPRVKRESGQVFAQHCEPVLKNPQILSGPWIEIISRRL
jgi:methyltransferase family protein